MPTLGQFKDLLQETLGGVELSLEMTNFLLASGRREIEKRVNTYWMTVTTDFLIEPNQASYAFASAPISRTAFKDIYFVSYREFQTNAKWNPVPHRSLQVLTNQFAPTAVGYPHACAVDGLSLVFFPLPMLGYQIRLHAFEWTTNPTDNVTAADELMARFPEAMLYAATMTGTLLMTKDQAMAKPWADLFVAEIPAIQKYSDQRIKRAE